jgi:tRNA(fMet)-specific endonuclease VapC
MYLLDTTHCLKLFWGVLEEKLLKSGKIIISTSVITRGELIYGVYKSERIDENLVEIEKFLDILDVYQVDDETASIYGNLKGEIVKRFGPKDKSKRRNFKIESLGFKDNDLWISATAIQHGLVLVSADKHVQRIHGINGLKVEVW